MTVPVHGLPPLLRDGLRIAAVPPALKQDRWHVVEHVVSGGGSGQLVRLSGVTGIADARALTGCMLLADTADLPQDYLRHDADALMGRAVVDTRHGELGIVSEVLVGPAHDVWVVEGPFGEVMVPVVDEFVVEVGPVGPLVVSVPEGTIAPQGGDSDAL